MMWTTEASCITTATDEQIWKLWADVTTWDKDVETAQLLGAFAQGTKSKLKPTGTPITNFTLVECTYLQSITSRSYLPLCQMDFIHTIQKSVDGLQISHKIEMKGLLSWVFSKLLGKQIQKGLPVAVTALCKLAENPS